MLWQSEESFLQSYLTGNRTMEETSATRTQVLTKTPTVAIIVAVWNRADITARFLAQLKPQLGRVNELIIVDDYSTDRTPSVLEWWKTRLKDKMVVVRNNQSNRGFGPSSNRGANLATSDIVIFMNNDIDIKGPFVVPTVEKLAVKPRSLVTAHLVDWDGGWNKFGDQLIVYAEGWYLAAWRELWEELGGFDEQFVPCDYEDQDISYRATQAGIHLIPLSLPIFHIGGISANQRERREITYRNRQRFIEKWGLKSA